MDKKRERTLICLMAVALLALPALHGMETYAGGRTDGLTNEHPGIIRFHIIANSDSPEDQQLKLEVRNYVLAKVQNEIICAVNREDAEGSFLEEVGVMRSYVKDNLPQIEEWAQEAIDRRGFGYGAKAQLGVRHIPAKYYGEMYFPEGNYEALTITLGEGAGENWWCVMFPPLCLVDSGDAAYEEELGVSEEDRLMLAFKTLELLRSSEVYSPGLYGAQAGDTYGASALRALTESCRAAGSLAAYEALSSAAVLN